MTRKAERFDPATRVASGLKTALIVCAVGFVALAANRALVHPGVSPVDAPAASPMIAPEVPTPALRPGSEASIAAPDVSADDTSARYEADNHPATF